MAELSTFAATTAALESASNNAQTTDNSTASVDNNGTLNNDTQSADATQSQDNSVADDSIIDFSLSGEQSDAAQQTAPADATTTQQTTTTQTFNLDEELKKADRKEILKKLGVSEFAIEIDTHIAGGGQPVDYLNARSVNYDTISDEELVRQELKKTYPSFSNDEINRMYNRKYGIDTANMSEDEIADATLELKAKGFELRQARKSEQEKFKIADVVHTPSKDEAYEQWKQSKEDNERLITQLQEFYNGHQSTKALNESKRVTISFGEGVKPLNFNIDKPELITTALMDGGQTFLQRSLNDKGEPDVQRQQLGAFLALDPYKAAQMIFNYGKSIGERGKVAEGQNAQRPTTSAGGGNLEQKPVYKTGVYGNGVPN